MQLGLNLAVFNNRTLAEALDLAAQIGVSTVELNAEHQDKLTPLSGWKREGRRIKKEVESRGLSISVLGNHADTQLIGGPFHEDTDAIFAGTREEKIQYGITALLNTARAAAELEIPTIVGFTGCEDGSRWFPWPDPTGWEKMLAPFVDTWRPLLDQMQTLGVRFAHEPHPKQLVHNLETALAVTQALDHHPSWGFNLDAANLALAGVDPSVFVQEMSDKIFHVHAKDLEFVAHNLPRSGYQPHGSWSRPDRGLRFRIPGWGNVDWKRLLTELRFAGYRGSLSIEHEDASFGRREGVEKAVAFLSPLLFRDPPDERWW